MQETLEQELHTLLIDCDRTHWKNLELKLLIQFAHMEKQIWEDKNLDYSSNNMVRIIEVAESLNKSREENNKSA